MKRSIPIQLNRRPQAKERDILKSVLDYLAAQRIWHRRFNTGAFAFGEGKGRRFFRAGSSGMADIFAWHRKYVVDCYMCTPQKNLGNLYGGCPNSYHEEYWSNTPLWLECKTKSGRQSEAQKAFQSEVEAEGMKYAIIRSIEDLKGIGL